MLFTKLDVHPTQYLCTGLYVTYFDQARGADWKVVLTTATSAFKQDS